MLISQPFNGRAIRSILDILQTLMAHFSFLREKICRKICAAALEWTVYTYCIFFYFIFIDISIALYAYCVFNKTLYMQMCRQI